MLPLTQGLNYRSACDTVPQTSNLLRTKVGFAATTSICIQKWTLVRDCRAQSSVRHSSRYRCWWSVCAGAIRFNCSLRHGRPPHSSAAPGALLWHNWFGTSMVPGLSGRPPPVRTNWFIYFVSSADSVWHTTDKSCSCCALLTCYCHGH